MESVSNRTVIHPRTESTPAFPAFVERQQWNAVSSFLCPVLALRCSSDLRTFTVTVTLLKCNHSLSTSDTQINTSGYLTREARVL